MAAGLRGDWSSIAWVADVVPRALHPVFVLPAPSGGDFGGIARLPGSGHAGGASHDRALGNAAACALAAVGQHFVHHWRVRVSLREGAERDPKKFFLLNDPSLSDATSEMLPPEGFVDFMRWSASQGLPVGRWTAKGAAAWMVWGLDGVLVFIPAVWLVGVTVRLPFCNRCGRWYHTMRGADRPRDGRGNWPPPPALLCRATVATSRTG